MICEVSIMHELLTLNTIIMKLSLPVLFGVTHPYGAGLATLSSMEQQWRD